MASFGALVGLDETNRFEEAARLGILPGAVEHDFKAVFMRLIPKDQQPQVSHAHITTKQQLTCSS
jgi:hypothetical protein